MKATHLLNLLRKSHAWTYIASRPRPELTLPLFVLTWRRVHQSGLLIKKVLRMIGKGREVCSQVDMGKVGQCELLLD